MCPLTSAQDTFNSRDILSSWFVFMKDPLTSHFHTTVRQLKLFLFSLNSREQLRHMKLINELLKLTVLITCNTASQEPPCNGGESTGLEPQGLASHSSSATISRAVLAKSLSPSSRKIKMMSLGK